MASEEKNICVTIGIIHILRQQKSGGWVKKWQFLLTVQYNQYCIYADIVGGVGQKRSKNVLTYFMVGWSLSDHLTVTLGRRGRKVVQKNPCVIVKS